MKQLIIFRPETEWLHDGEVEVVTTIPTHTSDGTPQMFMVRYMDTAEKPVLAFADELFIQVKSE